MIKLGRVVGEVMERWSATMGDVLDEKDVKNIMNITKENKQGYWEYQVLSYH